MGNHGRSVSREPGSAASSRERSSRWRGETSPRTGGRLLASVAGTAFAVTLMFMENGFRHAMLDSMVNVIERLNGQIVILNRTLYTLAVPYRVPLSPADPGPGGPGRHRGQPDLRRDAVRLLARPAGRLDREDLRDRRPARRGRAGPGRSPTAPGAAARSPTRPWPMRCRGPRASASSPPGRSPSSRAGRSASSARSSSGSTPSPTAT